MTVELRGWGAADKVQIIQVTPNQIGDGSKWTPITACQHIITEIEALAMEVITIPVKESAGLPLIREKAQEVRASLVPA